MVKGNRSEFEIYTRFYETKIFSRMIQNKKKLYDLTIMQIEFFIKKIKKKNFIKK